ncbi:helix-turn-helix domain-containing protein [Chromobacterium haemolyticum]|uniref:helix-turn-helix domain-containing protein n=1 Tax=Chromobacterium haemolyticum TaxID=394935 RepID=UPI00174683EC|nr:helix-turn-helix domain-containing protein [Chromobacterium haemolyticum]QOD81396.1 helix-turn-helix domain-containing protein [Chromobacterium haemolyticum]
MSSTQPPGWHKEDIKAAIRKAGSTMNALARDRNLPLSTIRNALIRPVLSGEVAIAEFLGIPAHELWPERWTPEGRRIRPRYAHKYIEANKSCS